MGTKIQHKRDNTTNWTANNPVILEGEFAYDTTTKTFRIGDGTNTWSALPEFNWGTMYYVGTWDASTAAYPTNPEEGQYYVVSVAGTVGAISYAINDWIVYNGSSWNKVDNQAGSGSPQFNETTIGGYNVLQPVNTRSIATSAGQRIGLIESDGNASWLFRHTDNTTRLYDGTTSHIIGDHRDGYFYNTLYTFSPNQVAIHHGLVVNQLRFTPPNLQEESDDFITWVASTRLTTSQLKEMMIGHGEGITNYNSYPIISITGTGQSGYYRFTWEATTGGYYIQLSNLFMDMNTAGNSVTILIEGYNDSGWNELWSGIVNNYPGHVYLPHGTFSFRTDYTGREDTYGKIRMSFIIDNSDGEENVTIKGIAWYGPYPFKSGEIMKWDGDQGCTFPANVNIPTGSTYNINGVPHTHAGVTAPVVVTVTNNYTVATTGDATILANANSSSFAVTLPAPTTSQGISVKKTDSSTNTITVNTTSGTIDGAATYILEDLNEFVTVTTDGTNWMIVGKTASSSGEGVSQATAIALSIALG